MDFITLALGYCYSFSPLLSLASRVNGEAPAVELRAVHSIAGSIGFILAGESHECESPARHSVTNDRIYIQDKSAPRASSFSVKHDVAFKYLAILGHPIP
jgi:hypothetical protein